MKETLYTIPLTDAFMAADECPLCFVERNVEQDLLDLVLGSSASYMESDMREETDKAGFCRAHFKKMFDYGNTLGNAWILKTHYIAMEKEFEKQVKMYSPGKSSFLNKLKKAEEGSDPMAAWIKEKEKSCYICDHYATTYERYLDTFFFMYKKDDGMKKMIENSKGFCLHHFGDICDRMERELSDAQRAELTELLFTKTQENLKRVGEDVAWLIEKFDYRNKDADWKDSKDAVQRGMQKLWGGYPADPVYQQSK
ncbi:MAG: DUF6062 family protein [Lachnospiraceae bacterium]|nr:DUF6062 family protein [Lachnospiraceae bacterium]